MTDATPPNSAFRHETGPAQAAAIREAAIREAPTHGRLLRSGRDGRILSAIKLPFFALSTPPGHGVLTTTGRKSGRDRRKILRVIRRADKAHLVMLRPPTRPL